MIGAVLGTNVIVSAVLTRGGAEAHTLDLAAAGKIQIYVTLPILNEYEEVIGRSKFSRIRPKVIPDALTLIRRIATLVNPKDLLAVSPDESDNRFLECADTADADYLVTGNRRHCPDHWKRTAVIGARELVELLIDAERAGKADR